MTIKNSTLYVLTFVLFAIISTPTLAADNGDSTIPVGTGVLLAVAVGIVFAYKAISAKLKKVSKHIEESIGEKI